MKERLKVAVLCGGDSPEREVSLRSGEGVHRALLSGGWRAELLAVDTYDGLPQRLAPYDVVFNIIHGGAGEDGTVQLLLDLLGKPYPGSGPEASALAMDKYESKRAFQAKGIPVPEAITSDREGLAQAVERAVRGLGLPLVVKPRAQGSSVGLRFVGDVGELREAVSTVTEEFGEALIEAFIPGRELTVAILEEEDRVRALPPLELRPRGAGRLFDWRAKYTPGECEFLCPADLSPRERERVEATAIEAFQALGCRDLCRVDMRLSPDGTPYVLEVNTLPGMTEMSTYPRMAAAAGIPYGELVERLLLRAVSRLPNPRGGR